MLRKKRLEEKRSAPGTTQHVPPVLHGLARMLARQAAREFRAASRHRSASAINVTNGQAAAEFVRSTFDIAKESTSHGEE